MNNISYVLFDAANTLIHKPDLWDKMMGAMAGNDIIVDKENLQKHHKLISEIIFFPDVTSADFYKKFNAELMYSLGIIPTDKLLADIFTACTYLPWKPFDDTVALDNLPFRKGVLSNFNSSLAAKITGMFPGVFSEIIISEELQCAKPDLIFYEKAIQRIGEPVENILYVGDSIKLDMEPALKIGMKVCLIDRLGCFKGFAGRISSLKDLVQFTNSTLAYGR